MWIEKVCFIFQLKHTREVHMATFLSKHINFYEVFEYFVHYLAKTLTKLSIILPHVSST
jgi:hypothetical protein